MNNQNPYLTCRLSHESETSLAHRKPNQPYKAAYTYIKGECFERTERLLWF